ncbi:MAG: hypothetical protein ABI707_05200 [Ferruginibacter sp.]
MKIIYLILFYLLFCQGNAFTQPANDDPCGAITIPVSIGDLLGQNCNPTTAYGWSGSTLTSATPNPSCFATGYSNIRDVWYKLLVPASGKLQITVGAFFTHYLIAYNPAVCSATLTFSEISCLTYPGAYVPGIMNLTSLAPGSTIFLRVMRTTEAVNSISNIYMCAAEVLDIPIVDNSTRIGVGTLRPLAKLDVAGTAIVRDSLLVTNNIETRGNLKSKTIQLSGGANRGYILQSDTSGNASWVTP